MLDGLLGRSGFYTKCKSLIKLTRTRIDVVKRKRNATQKFLRKDIADLLANGLDANAYGRVEGLIAELILSSCYDFIEHVCEIIVKHLPVLQKLRECPEDCREAVASLMFAAARLSDLPELRELRDLFQERYGSSLEFYVNQKLVENLTPKPPSMEKKFHLMQEIASEFSIRWDSKGFEERMSNPSTAQNQPKSHGNVPAAANKVLTPVAEKKMHKTVKDEDLVKKRSEATYEREVDDRHHKETGREGIPRRRDYLKNNISATERNKPHSYREETIQKREHHHISYQRSGQKTEIHDSQETSGLEAVQFGNSSRGKTLEFENKFSVPERESPNTLSQQRPAPSPRNTHLLRSVNNEVADDVQVRSMRKQQDEVKDGLKSNPRSAIPPPYVKPRKSKRNDRYADPKESNSIKSENVQTKPDGPDHLNGATAPEKSDGPGRFTEIYYRDAGRGDFTPRRRSFRRKQSRSMSTKDDGANDDVGPQERVVRRVSSSRRKHESRKGLQIVVDDGDYSRDKEEKMIDKLLLLYSKKPSAGDPGKKSRNTDSEMNESHKSPDHHKAVDGTHEGASSVTKTSRSMSLPTQQTTQPEAQKVFTRTPSFQQDTPAKHVHPKLPDYDDLAARFAALRAAKG